MRIAMFSWKTLHSRAVGGIAAHVTELAAALQRRGHEVHVSCDVDVQPAGLEMLGDLVMTGEAGNAPMDPG